ncbi:hypothetical protein QFZ34_001852 [Phyllobacterium ifriqiyense]|uniref:Uncharacterized protein n=1 Tax=Phyllobacterium ifriqiyense TaxID=314238 RepID=A0ABU0S9U3_9HYPH|nr:hypothetical protein [Phyllobacterium ifriqiyense]
MNSSPLQYETPGNLGAMIGGNNTNHARKARMQRFLRSTKMPWTIFREFAYVDRACGIRGRWFMMIVVPKRDGPLSRAKGWRWQGRLVGRPYRAS